MKLSVLLHKIEAESTGIRFINVLFYSIATKRARITNLCLRQLGLPSFLCNLCIIQLPRLGYVAQYLSKTWQANSLG